MKRVLYLTAALALLSAPVLAQPVTGGEGTARTPMRGDQTGMGQRSGTAAPATGGAMGAGGMAGGSGMAAGSAGGERMAMPSRGKKMTRSKRSSKKMTRSRRSM